MVAPAHQVRIVTMKALRVKVVMAAAVAVM
jgi:hypothetical protein